MSRLSRFFSGLKRAAWSNFFEGAQMQSNQRSYIYSTATDSRHEITNYTRRNMLAVSRYLTSNLGVVRGIYRDMALYSNIGSPQSQSANRAWAEEAEMYWKNVGKIMEVTGRHDWESLQFLLDLAMDRDGDIGLILLDQSFPQVQVVEAHRIDDAGKGDSCDGVIVNRVGRPVAYRILEGEDREPRVIPAEAFLHIYEPDRLDQCRGICALHAGLNNGRDIADILRDLKITVKLEAGIAVLKQTKTGEAHYNDWGNNATATDTTATTGKMLEDIYGARIERFAEGEDIKSFATDRPSPNVEQFLEFLIRDIAYGIGLPFEFCWNASKLSGPSMRFVMAKAQRRVEQRQRLKMRYANRLWGWVIAKGAKRGDIGKLPEDWWKVRWQTPAAITIDVGREMAQERADFLAGLTDPSEFFSKQGLDIDDVLESRAQWAKKVIDKAKEHDVPDWMLYQATANGNPTNTDEPAEPVEPQPKPDTEDNPDGE